MADVGVNEILAAVRDKVGLMQGCCIEGRTRESSNS
jgi:hypothetical protein